MGKSDSSSELKSMCSSNRKVELQQAEPTESGRGNENMLSEQVEGEYDALTPLDWANYELDMLYYDYRMNPELNRRIRNIVERMYYECQKT